MTWCWQRRPLDRPAFPATHSALVDLRAGRVPNLPALPIPSPYTAVSPHHHDPYTPYESHAHPSTALFHPPVGGSCLVGGGGRDTHSCLAGMRAGSRGSFCSTDLLPATARPCSCLPHAAAASCHTLPSQQHSVTSCHTLPSHSVTSCHTLPRNASAAAPTVQGSPKHAHRLSQSGPHHHSSSSAHHHHHTTLPRAAPQQGQLFQQQYQPTELSGPVVCSDAARREDELREVPEEPLSTSSTGPPADSSIASASPPSVTSASSASDVGPPGHPDKRWSAQVSSSAN